jgi:probable HAF family extracellular repeat protein
MNTKSIAQKLSLATASVALLAIGTVDPATAVSLYSITELPFTASDINDRGQIVGSQYLWDNGTVTQLGFLPGANFTNAKAINNLGQVVGSSGVLNNYSRAFIWQNGVMSGLGTASHPICQVCYYGNANDINDRGQVVGNLGLIDPPLGYPPTFLWANGTLIDAIGLAYYTSAQAINNSGKAVVNMGRHGSMGIWPNGISNQLNTPTTFWSISGHDINNNDQVVASGLFFSSSGGNWLGLDSRALLWDGDTVIDLGNLFNANSINDATIVVGSSRINTTTSHASLWEKGKFFDLNTLIPANSGWELESALKINNKNQIIGTGKFNGESRSFLLTPEATLEAKSVPEPTSALGILGLGGIGVGLRLWSKRKSVSD